MGFEKWFEQYAPTAPRMPGRVRQSGLVCRCRSRGMYGAENHAGGFRHYANPTQFRSALAAAVAKGRLLTTSERQK